MMKDCTTARLLDTMVLDVKKVKVRDYLVHEIIEIEYCITHYPTQCWEIMA